MKISFFHEFIPPKTTNQQRRQNAQGGYLHNSGKIAKAIWTAVLEQYRPNKPITGPVEMEVILTWPHTKVSAKAAKNINSAVIPKTTRPDGDNLIKMIKDIMQKIGYFYDDAQIYDERISRWHGEIPGVAVNIKTPLEP